MSAQHPYSSGPDGQPIIPAVPAPEYSRRFVLNLAGSVGTLCLSGATHTLAPSHSPVNESADLPAAPTVMVLGASIGWVVATIGMIALRELRYGFNRAFPRVQIFHVYLPESDESGRRRGAPRRRPRSGNK